MCCEEATVDDTSHGEGATYNGADRGEEVVDGGTGLVVADSDGIQIVPVNKIKKSVNKTLKSKFWTRISTKYFTLHILTSFT